LGWSLAPDEVAQRRLKSTSICDVTHKKNTNPKLSKFLIESTSVSSSLEGLNSFLAQLAGELHAAGGTK